MFQEISIVLPVLILSALFSIFGSHSEATRRRNPPDQIQRGRLFNLEDRRYLVTIDIEFPKYSEKLKDTHVGAIISKDYVLGTAPSHMLSNPRFVVRVGSDSFDRNGDVYEAELIQLKASTQGSSPKRNLLIRLILVLYKVRRPIKFGLRAHPIDLVDTKDRSTSKQKAIFKGWRTSMSGRSDPRSDYRIWNTEVEILTSEQCKASMRENVVQLQGGNGSIVEMIPFSHGYTCSSGSNKNSSVVDVFEGATLLRAGKLAGFWTGYLKLDAMRYVYIDVAFHRESIRSITGI